jgi:hypothetical protein
MNTSSPWLYQGDIFTLEVAGEAAAFVYLITNLIVGRKYIGQKLLTKAKTFQKNGKKKKTRVESDWESYWGSNKDLQADVEKLGEGNFKREIIYLAANKAEANYVELKEQITHDVLLRPDYYNKFIGRRIGPQGLSRLSPSPSPPSLPHALESSEK